MTQLKPTIIVCVNKKATFTSNTIESFENTVLSVVCGYETFFVAMKRCSVYAYVFVCVVKDFSVSNAKSGSNDDDDVIVYM